MRALWILSLLLGVSTAQAQTVRTVRFASFGGPVYLASPPNDLARVFVASLYGSIEILDARTGATRPSPFLSLTNQNILGFAFSPSFASNGHVFVYVEDPDNACHLVRYTVSASNPDRADPASARTILSFPATDEHVGGWLGFGPDGDLYLQVGDGGPANDPAGRAQSITGELQGNVLRLDPEHDDFPADGGRNYAIPAGNPFVGVAGEDEIWAFGLRNPWRGSFDRATGDYFIADVGEDNREEIDFERAGSPGGRNYGWRLREGTIATPTGGVGGPEPPGGVDPIYDYAHGPLANQGYCITGGYVYRGPVTALQGQYFFGDCVTGRIWSILVDRNTGAVSNLTDWTTAFTPDVGSITDVVSFGEDALGNLFILDLNTGAIFKIVGPTAIPGTGPFVSWALIGLLGAVALRRSLQSPTTRKKLGVLREASVCGPSRSGSCCSCSAHRSLRLRTSEPCASPTTVAPSIWLRRRTTSTGSSSLRSAAGSGSWTPGPARHAASPSCR